LSDIEDKGCETLAPTNEPREVTTDIHHIPPSPVKKKKIPNMQDFLVAYSTVPGLFCTSLFVITPQTKFWRVI